MQQPRRHLCRTHHVLGPKNSSFRQRCVLVGNLCIVLLLDITRKHVIAFDIAQISDVISMWHGPPQNMQDHMPKAPTIAEQVGA